MAQKYAASPNIVFGLMNEPHGVPSVSLWKDTVQASVSAIRAAGATSQMILRPGNDWTSAGASVDKGSAAALDQVVNDGPGGKDKKGLIFDFHGYFDVDHSGTSRTCATNLIDEGWARPVNFLRQHGRMALEKELGGANDDDCVKYICQALDFFNENSDVYLGWTAWSAGAFDASYELSMVDEGGQETPLMTQCFMGKFQGGLTDSAGSDPVGSDPIGSDTKGNGSVWDTTSTGTKPEGGGGGGGMTIASSEKAGTMGQGRQVRRHRRSKHFAGIGFVGEGTRNA